MALEQGKSWLWYLNTGTIASPTWTEIPHQKDGNVEVSQSFINTTTKSNDGWTSQSPSTKDFVTDLTLFYDQTETTHNAIVAAAFAQTLLQFKVEGVGESYVFTSYVGVKIGASVDNMCEMSVTFGRLSAPVRSIP